MITDEFLKRFVEKTLVEDNQAEKATHIASGKLSASGLGNPLQWQVLKYLGIPSKEIEPFLLGKFLRGNHVEDLVIKWLEKLDIVKETQKEIEYKDTIGLVDAVTDTSKFDTLDLKDKLIPNEIKSVSNMKFKRINDTGADPQHSLQAALYALAMGTENFVIHYISTDDYRIKTFIGETEKFAKEIDEIIETYNKQLGFKEVPVFKARYNWQGTRDARGGFPYNNYPEWADLSAGQIEEKLQKEYPESYKKLKGGGK